MNLTGPLKPFTSPLILVAGVVVIALITQLLGVSLLTRIVTVMFIS